MATEQKVPLTADLRKYIDTSYYGERPHIRGRRLLVSMVAANYETNARSVAELAHEFTISKEEVLAALLYFREHRAEIERQDTQEEELFDKMACS